MRCNGSPGIDLTNNSVWYSSQRTNTHQRHTRESYQFHFHPRHSKTSKDRRRSPDHRMKHHSKEENRWRTLLQRIGRLGCKGNRRGRNCWDRCICRIDRILRRRVSSRDELEIGMSLTACARVRCPCGRPIDTGTWITESLADDHQRHKREEKVEKDRDRLIVSHFEGCGCVYDSWCAGGRGRLVVGE